MEILVTGGNGFLGRRIVEKLLASDHSVRSLARSPQDELEALGVSTIRGCLTNPIKVNNAVAGVDAVIHTAAKAGIWGRYQDFFEPNTAGTYNIVKACHTQKVKHLVYTSSPSVVFGGKAHAGADESLAYPRHHYCHYATTKALAEHHVLTSHQPGKLHTAALRPHLIMGPGDPHLVPQLLARAQAKKLRIIGDGNNRVDFTHVDNAAQAHILALNALIDGTIGGKAYFLSDDNPTPLWPWIHQFLKKNNLAITKSRLSYHQAYSLGYACEAAYSAFKVYNKQPPMTRFLAQTLSQNHYFDITAAKSDFGYSPDKPDY